MMRRVLRFCGHIACTHHTLVLIVAFLITILSLLPLFQTKTKFTASVRKMMPSDNLAARAFDRALNDFGTADEVLIAIRVQSPSEVDNVGIYAIQLAEVLRQHPDFVDAYCRYIRPEERGFLEEEIIKRGALYLPLDGAKEIASLLTEEAIRNNVKKTYKRLSTPMTEDKERLIRLNTLNFLPVFQKYLAGSYDNFSSSGRDNLMVGRGEKDSIILVVAQPDGPAQQLEYSNRIMDIVRNETWKIFGEGKGWVSESIWWKPWTWLDGHEAITGILPPALSPQVIVEFAGGYEAAVRYTANIGDSLISTLISSLIGVLILFGYFYRRYGVFLYVGVPLIMVVCWTIGAGYLLFGKINMISSAFAAVLVGLGVDYAIHIYNRYIEERNHGYSVEESFLISLENTGTGVIVGMLTTSASFFALHLTRFKGLSQFGTLAGVGLALALPAMVFVLPAMVVWRSKKGKGENIRALQNSGFHLPLLAVFVEKNAKPIAIIGLLLAIFGGGYGIWGNNPVAFDERLATLRPTQDRVFILGEEISERFTKKSPAKQMLLITGETEAEAMNNASALLSNLEKLKQEGLLKDFEILTQRLPAPEQQSHVIQFLSTIDFDKAESSLRKELDSSGLDPDQFKESFSFLSNHRALATSSRAVLPSDFQGTPLWRLIRRMVTRHKINLLLETDFGVENSGEPERTLSEPPLSRDGTFYFQRGEPVTAPSLTYLKSLGITDLSVGVFSTDGQSRKQSTLAIPLIEERLSKGETVIFSDSVLNKEGHPLLAHGTSVTPELISFLRNSDCKSIDCYGEGYSVLGYIYPPNEELKGLELSDEWIQAIRQRLGVNEENILLTGTMIVAHELATIVKDDFVKISIAVTFICTFVLILCLRDFYRVFYSLIPIALALLYLFGIMSAGSIHFNFINILVVPILIGLGVDNGIHLVHRFYNAKGDIRPVIVDTGRAIIITNLTSMVGFGSLWIGSYSGLQSMGKLTVIGLSASLFASLVVLPALMLIFLKKKIES